TPVWSPDGKRLAFLSSRDGALRLWVWERNGGEMRRLSDGTVPRRIAARRMAAPQWMRDSRQLIIAFGPDTPAGAVQAADAPAQSTVVVFRSPQPPSAPGKALATGEWVDLSDLVRVDAMTGTTVAVRASI